MGITLAYGQSLGAEHTKGSESDVMRAAILWKGEGMIRSQIVPKDATISLTVHQKLLRYDHPAQSEPEKRLAMSTTSLDSIASPSLLQIQLPLYSLFSSLITV